MQMYFCGVPRLCEWLRRVKWTHIGQLPRFCPDEQNDLKDKFSGFSTFCDFQQFWSIFPIWSRRRASAPHKDTSIIGKYDLFWLRTHQNRPKRAQRPTFQVVNGGTRSISEPYFFSFWQDLTLLPILLKYAFRDAGEGSYWPVKDKNRQKESHKSY